MFTKKKYQPHSINLNLRRFETALLCHAESLMDIEVLANRIEDFKIEKQLRYQCLCT